MDYVIPIFALASTAILCGLCLIVLEYQNGRSRRLSQIWMNRVRDLSAERGPQVSSIDPIPEKDTQAA